MKRCDLSLDKNCDREVQLRICAGRLFHAVGADIENELSTQRGKKYKHTLLQFLTMLRRLPSASFLSIFTKPFTILNTSIKSSLSDSS